MPLPWFSPFFRLYRNLSRNQFCRSTAIAKREAPSPWVTLRASWATYGASVLGNAVSLFWIDSGAVRELIIAVLVSSGLAAVIV